MRRRNVEILFAIFAGASFAAMSIQTHVIHEKQSEIERIVELQRSLMDRVTQFRLEFERKIGQ